MDLKPFAKQVEVFLKGRSGLCGNVMASSVPAE
jgi:hypothetical protein